MRRYWWLLVPMLTACTQVEQTYKNDPVAVQIATQQTGIVLQILAVSAGIALVAWAIAWAYVNRRRS